MRVQASQYGSYGSASGSFDLPPQQTQYNFPGHQPQPSLHQVRNLTVRVAGNVQIAHCMADNQMQR